MKTKRKEEELKNVKEPSKFRYYSMNGNIIEDISDKEMFLRSMNSKERINSKKSINKEKRQQNTLSIKQFKDCSDKVLEFRPIQQNLYIYSIEDNPIPVKINDIVKKNKKQKSKKRINKASGIKEIESICLTELKIEQSIDKSKIQINSNQVQVPKIEKINLKSRLKGLINNSNTDKDPLNGGQIDSIFNNLSLGRKVKPYIKKRYFSSSLESNDLFDRKQKAIVIEQKLKNKQKIHHLSNNGPNYRTEANSRVFQDKELNSIKLIEGFLKKQKYKIQKQRRIKYGLDHNSVENLKKLPSVSNNYSSALRSKLSNAINCKNSRHNTKITSKNGLKFYKLKNSTPKHKKIKIQNSKLISSNETSICCSPSMIPLYPKTYNINKKGFFSRSKNSKVKMRGKNSELDKRQLNNFRTYKKGLNIILPYSQEQMRKTLEVISPSQKNTIKTQSISYINDSETWKENNGGKILTLNETKQNQFKKMQSGTLNQIKKWPPVYRNLDSRSPSQLDQGDKRIKLKKRDKEKDRELLSGWKTEIKENSMNSLENLEILKQQDSDKQKSRSKFSYQFTFLVL